MTTEHETKTEAASVPRVPLGRWTSMRNPFAAKPAPKTEATMVQTEMRLDAVKPVRNDLSDADLELVPARQSELEAAESKSGAEAQPLPRFALARLFGAGRS